MIDQNRDGFIDKEDLHDMLASLGKTTVCFERFVQLPCFRPSDLRNKQVQIINESMINDLPVTWLLYCPF